MISYFAWLGCTYQSSVATASYLTAREDDLIQFSPFCCHSVMVICMSTLALRRCQYLRDQVLLQPLQ